MVRRQSAQAFNIYILTTGRALNLKHYWCALRSINLQYNQNRVTTRRCFTSSSSGEVARREETLADFLNRTMTSKQRQNQTAFEECIRILEKKRDSRIYSLVDGEGDYL